MVVMRSFIFAGLSAVALACGADDSELFAPVPQASADGGSSATDGAATADGSTGADSSATPDGAATVDGSVTPVPDAGPTCGGANPHACDNLKAGGWIPVAFAAAQNKCPAKFNKEQHPVTTPVAADGACACGIATQTPPDCQSGNMTTFYDVGINATCGTQGSTINFASGNCRQGGGQFGNHFSGNPLPPTGGACTAAAPKTDLSKVTATTTTTCEPTACAESICEGTAPSTFAACVEQAGDLVCPAPFINRTLVGDSAAVSACGACACTVTNKLCSKGQFYSYSDGQCGNQTNVLPVDTTCNGVGNKFFGSLRYTATASATYTAGPSTPTLGLLNTKTVCCR